MLVELSYGNGLGETVEVGSLDSVEIANTMEEMGLREIESAITLSSVQGNKQYFLEKSKVQITPAEIASEMLGLRMPDILVVSSLEGLKMLRQIFEYQNSRYFDVYLVTNQIGKTVKELELQNKELFTRLRELGIYVNDVYYITKRNSS